MDQAHSSNARWLWLCGFTSFAVFMLSGGKLLLGLGFLLLGVFAFFNNPLSPTPKQLPNARIVIKVSWACGAIGIIAVLAAAVSAWL